MIKVFRGNINCLVHGEEGVMRSTQQKREGSEVKALNRIEVERKPVSLT